MYKYSNNRKINGDYFIVQKRSNLKYKNDLDYYINHINFDNYYMFKASNSQRQVSVEDFMEFKYSSYVFFKKDLFNLDLIMQWVNSDYMIHFLTRPVPPFPPSKIIYRSINR